MRNTVAAVFAALALTGLAGRSSATVEFYAYATCSSPGAGGTTIHTGSMLYTATVLVSSSGHYIEITGAAARAHYNLDWSLQVECDTNVDTGSWDHRTSEIITCDPSGHFRHNASGTGSIGGTFTNVGVGTHDCKAYTSVVDNNDGSHSRTATGGPNTATVVHP